MKNIIFILLILFVPVGCELSNNKPDNKLNISNDILSSSELQIKEQELINERSKDLELINKNTI